MTGEYHLVARPAGQSYEAARQSVNCMFNPMRLQALSNKTRYFVRKSQLLISC